MTAKMQSCIDHIKTSTDVDPWAMEMVERIFTEYDKRFDKALEIIAELNDTKALVAKTPLGKCLHDTLANEIVAAVEALKGGET